MLERSCRFTGGGCAGGGAVPGGAGWPSEPGGGGGAGGTPGDVHLPASHTRSPLQSMSLVHCAWASALARNTAPPLDKAQIARPRMAEKLAVKAAFSKKWTRGAAAKRSGTATRVGSRMSEFIAEFPGRTRGTWLAYHRPSCA